MHSEHACVFVYYIELFGFVSVYFSLALPPDEPQNFTVSALNTTSVNVSWLISNSTAEQPINNFTLSWNNESYIVQAESDVVEYSYIINNLKPGCEILVEIYTSGPFVNSSTVNETGQTCK